MSDEFTKKAKALIMEMKPSFKMDEYKPEVVIEFAENIINIIAKALLQARDEALEEAASLCELSVAPSIDDFINQRLQALNDARSIRALKSKDCK